MYLPHTLPESSQHSWPVLFEAAVLKSLYSFMEHYTLDFNRSSARFRRTVLQSLFTVSTPRRGCCLLGYLEWDSCLHTLGEEGIVIYLDVCGSLR